MGKLVTAENRAGELERFHRAECPDLNSDEFALFVARCEKRGIDPLLRFVVPQLYVDKRSGKRRVTDITTIDAYRSIAQGTGEYKGQTRPMWCGADGKWRDVWLEKEHPLAAVVCIHREGFVEPVGQPALWSEYAQTYNGKPNRAWGSMGALMLAKCSESLGFRKAFPEQLSGTYTAEEMQQAQDESQPEKPSPFNAEPDVIKAYVTAIGDAADEESLKNVGKKVAALKLGAQDELALREVYAAKLKDLRDA